jgi:hypothetical protein
VRLRARQHVLIGHVFSGEVVPHASEDKIVVGVVDDDGLKKKKKKEEEETTLVRL